MKALITILVLFVCLQITKAQIYITIPDANFVTWLQANVPSAMVGNQMNISDPSVTGKKTIDVYSLNISDISGIEHFTSLDTLICSFNQISNLPVLSNTLSYLICEFNQLSSLPSLPPSLKKLYCAHNQLLNIPILPNSLTVLSCWNNPIANLPSLPNSLIELYCMENQLTGALPVLPNSVQVLSCSSNSLASLPSLPNSLIYLDCAGNQLTSLPPLPISLTSLFCNNNQLNYIASFPLGLTDLICSHNNILCFPPFPTHGMNYFDISYNPFTCLPNYSQSMNAATLNYPLCVPGNTVTNPNGCISSKVITGTVFRDINFDCTKNTSELGITNSIIKLFDSSNNFLGLTTAFNNGIYSFNDTAGTYHVVLDTVNKPYIVQCINPGIDSMITLTPIHPLEDSVDFAIICKPGFDIGVQSIYRTGSAFPVTTHTLTVFAGDMSQWNNMNCTTGISGTVSFAVAGPVTYIGPASGALTPNVAGNIYTYTITDFGTINNVTDFKLVFQTDTTAQAGDVICVNATVTPISGDNNPTNNIYQYCYNVTNSFDPNIKEVYPVEVTPNYNDWLTYTIHFQNTGNAPAINIRLEDQLDAKLDPETFQLINYSHNNIIDVTDNHLTVRFPNIQLADSTSNPQGSIGFVQYRIKPKAGWITDTIKNLVEIYFDYNAPIVTNTAKSYFIETTSIKDISYLSGVVGVSPNPANGTITISSLYDMQRIELISTAGQLLLSETTSDKTHQLNLSELSVGIYFMKVIYENGLTVAKKVIKQ